MVGRAEAVAISLWTQRVAGRRAHCLLNDAALVLANFTIPFSRQLPASQTAGTRSSSSLMRPGAIQPRSIIAACEAHPSVFVFGHSPRHRLETSSCVLLVGLWTCACAHEALDVATLRERYCRTVSSELRQLCSPCILPLRQAAAAGAVLGRPVAIDVSHCFPQMCA